MMSAEAKVIDNAVWRRWRGQQNVNWKWSWPRFLVACGIAILLADVASTLICEPILLRLLAGVAGVSTLLIAFVKIGTVGSGGKQFIARVLPVGIFVALVATNAPLKWRFALVSDEFDRVATRYEAGEQVDVPFTIGPWEIVEISRGYDESGPVMFWESVDGMGCWGFVRHPEGHGVNTLSVVPLDDQWAWVSED